MEGEKEGEGNDGLESKPPFEGANPLVGVIERVFFLTAVMGKLAHEYEHGYDR